MAPTNSIVKKDSVYRSFLVRLAGVAGLLIGGVGGVLISVGSSWLGTVFWLGIVLAVVGGVAAVLALVLEVRYFADRVASRRSTAGSNVALQIVLAAVILLLINAFAFFHYQRIDWTYDHEFTLDPDLQAELAKLRGATTIVVNVRHNFGQIGSDRDEYDHAAERVVVDKIEEVAEQLRQLGPQFQVFVLDVKDKRYGDKLNSLVKSTKSDALKKGIQASTEDSIFILANEKVTRLGFQDLFQLDKNASKHADHDKGNLVMHYQGAGLLVRRILNLDNRKPRVAVGVIHEALSTKSVIDEFTMAGAGKALADNGFETEDIILKSDLETRTPKPAVRTLDENKYEDLDYKLAKSAGRVTEIKKALKKQQDLIKHWRTAKLDDLSKEYSRQLRGVKLKTDEERNMVIRDNFEVPLEYLVQSLKEEEDYGKEMRKERSGLNVADMAEQRRLTDLRAKLDRKLENCDLLILPRLTVIDLASGRAIPNSLYKLDPAQEAAVEDFLKKGKPVLALFGPSNDPRGMPADMMHAGADSMEMLLTQLGFRLGKETFLYDAEEKSFGEQRGSFFIMGAQATIPPARFEWKSAMRSGKDDLLFGKRPDLPANPIAESMRLTVAGLDQKQDGGLGIKAPRPVEYFGFGPARATDPTFLMTDPRGWKTANPFPTEEGPPKKDPKSEGQVSIGVAAEVTLPPQWKSEKRTARVAVIGQGGVFVGKQLSSVREKLLLDVCNWLLGRDDLLNHPQKTPWSYPRVAMSETQNSLWQWATRLGIPILFVFAGVVVLMVRAMR